MNKINLSLGFPELLYDYELIVSRDTEKFMPLHIPPDVTLPVFYIHDEDTFYLKLNKEDTRFYETYTDAQSKKYEIKEEGNIEMIKYFRYGDYEKIIKYPIRNLIEIPGVKADFFNLRTGKRDYWRFRFIKEALKPASDYLVKAISEINSALGTGTLNIEYLGKPHTNLWYLQKYDYSRAVVAVKIREINTQEYRNNAAHYSYPFHDELKYFNKGEETYCTLRFTTHASEPSGVTEIVKVLRNFDLVVTEETLKPIINLDFPVLRKDLYLAALWTYQDYDGTDPIHTWIIDVDDLNTLLARLKSVNELLKKYAHFVIESVDDFYDSTKSKGRGI